MIDWPAKLPSGAYNDKNLTSFPLIATEVGMLTVSLALCIGLMSYFKIYEGKLDLIVR